MAGRKPGLPPISEAQRVEVEGWLRRRTLPPRVRERLEMVKAAALGQDARAIARWSGRTERTVCQWVGRYSREGVEGLADAPRAGRRPHADAAHRTQLERLGETEPATLGLPCDMWTSARLGAHLATPTGVRITPGWLRALLGRRRFACGRPKHTLTHLQDAAAVRACEAELAAAEKKGRRRAGAAGAAPPG